ncbi:MAG: hypothetical protein VX640_13160 [Pseudomonadota bacterium]|nr:hypothetical protein [Pseudomonadota bacterium]
MRSDPIETLLATDFAAAAAELENDGFTALVLERLTKAQMTRQALIWIAGGAGALIAGAQFAGMTRLFSPLVAAMDQTPALGAAASNLATNAVAPQLFAAAAIAVAFAATALVLQGER